MLKKKTTLEMTLLNSSFSVCTKNHFKALLFASESVFFGATAINGKINSFDQNLLKPYCHHM